MRRASVRAFGRDASHSTDLLPAPVELTGEDRHVSKNQRQPPRKPATKFAHLRKKMQKQKVQAKKSRKR
jgi:hypothetical protein